MILILTQPFDLQADHVEPMLKARGAEVLRLDPSDFPMRTAVSIGYSAEGGIHATLRIDSRIGERTLDLSRLQAVWNLKPRASNQLRSPGSPMRNGWQDHETFVQELWNAVPALWLPGRPAAFARAQFQASQLRAAAELGLDMPPTLITADRREFLDFYNRHRGQIVSTSGGFPNQTGMRSSFNRSAITGKAMADPAQSAVHHQIVAQAYIPRVLELRVIVVGRQVFTTGVRPQQSNSSLAGRQRPDLHDMPLGVYELPPQIQERCLRLVEELDLCYGAIDFIQTADGRHIFTGFNPAGPYLAAEKETQLPISDAVCDFLMSGQGVMA